MFVFMFEFTFVFMFVIVFGFGMRLYWAAYETMFEEARLKLPQVSMTMNSEIKIEILKINFGNLSI